MECTRGFYIKNPANKASPHAPTESPTVRTLPTPRCAAALDFLDAAVPDADDVEEPLVPLPVDDPELEPVPDEDVAVGAGVARVNIRHVV